MILVNTYSELLALDGREFVNAAYWLVIERAPDEAGLAYYVSRLRIGYSKFSILSQLGTSNEARSWDAVPGLSKAMRRYRSGQWPLLGYMFRKLWRVEGESLDERRQRAMISNLAEVRNQLTAIAAANSEFQLRLTAKIETINAGLERSSAEISNIAAIQSNLFAAAAASALSSVGDASSNTKLPQPRNLSAEQLSPRAREAFDRLVSG